ncbi:MAG: transcription antitermination factor NusB [Christensenellales bacterium]|mgnify:CR=1 FL=1|nr:transcription antitermination factor NusB [Christensenellales bacterium]
MRRASREYVFKLVFEYTFYGKENPDTLELFLTDADLDDEDKAFIRDCYDGVSENADALKAELAGKLERYTVDRLYRPDLCVLLIALYELKKGETPAKVVVNEAVSLAKKYGTEKSGAFVNGVLAKFVREKGQSA